ncbi:MAG: hypothetical protein F4013_03680 [Gammaproteobacteria bacterium]|nr:hypothetical protein [Gammaproteobacteria bacterium]
MNEIDEFPTPENSPEDVSYEALVLVALRDFNDDIRAGDILSLDAVNQLTRGNEQKLRDWMGKHFGLRDILIGVPPSELRQDTCAVSRGLVQRRLTPEEAEARREAEAEAERKRQERAAAEERARNLEAEAEAARQEEAEARERAARLDREAAEARRVA